jgi:hypothetical protein
MELGQVFLREFRFSLDKYNSSNTPYMRPWYQSHSVSPHSYGFKKKVKLLTNYLNPWLVHPVALLSVK